jgi:hypothetical protein
MDMIDRQIDRDMIEGYDDVVDIKIDMKDIHDR